LRLAAVSVLAAALALLPATVKLKLPRNLRRLLIRKHRLSLRLSAVVEDPAGNQRSVARTVKPRLKTPRHTRRHPS
jgi:hypothetical protein